MKSARSNRREKLVDLGARTREKDVKKSFIENRTQVSIPEKVTGEVQAGIGADVNPLRNRQIVDERTEEVAPKIISRHLRNLESCNRITKP
jgi:hypothetical protein